jgi:predicted dehydrogenase
MHRWKTVLCGFGSVAAGIAKDKRMSRFIKYQTHAQVLNDHLEFDWLAVVDPDPEARRIARDEWNIPVVVNSPKAVLEYFEPDVAILATGPGPRADILRDLPSVRAIIVEKPLGYTFEKASAFAKLCKECEIICQVNLFRRTDKTYHGLVSGNMHESIGETQAATVLYGNGLLNNGVHMIDLVRMLLGEIMSVRALGTAEVARNQTIKDDIDVPCALTLNNGAIVTMHPIDFSYYRDVMIDVWGTRGRLEIYQEGLFLRLSQLKEHRALEETYEIDIDNPINLESYCGSAYYELYDDLAKSLRGEKQHGSPLENALQAEKVVEAIRISEGSNGVLVPVNSVDAIND